MSEPPVKNAFGTACLTLRFREGLRKRIEDAASARGVSMNSEINRRLERSFDRGDILDWLEQRGHIR